LKPKKFDCSVVKWIWLLYKPFHKNVFVILLFIGSLEGLSLLSPIIYGKIINSFFLGSSLQTTLSFIALSLALYIVMGGIDYWNDRYALKYFEFKVQQYISNIIFEKNLSFSIGQHLSTHTGIKQNIVSRGQSSLMSLAFMFSFDIVPSVLRILFVIFLLLYTSILVGGVVVCGACLFIYATIKINKVITPKAKIMQNLWQENGKLQHEFISNITLVKSHSQEQKVFAEYDRNSSGVRRFCSLLWTRYSTFMLLRSSIPIITRITIMVIGAILVYKKVFLPGYLMVLFSWSSDVFNVLGRFGRMQRQIIDMYAAIKKLHVLYTMEPAVKTIENPVRPNIFHGKIEFRNVSFSYPERTTELFDDKDDPKNRKKRKKQDVPPKETLHNVSFSIESGQTVAFVGASGSGKTTIANLLLRAFDPIEGQILIDDNDLRILDLGAYRKKVGYVEQNVSLFDNSLRYNILFGLNGEAKHITEDQLKLFAQMACIDKFYDKLENGFDTVIGEHGIWLSGGERQRVGIARAIAKSPAILIFDEATSSLDSENESIIKDSIKRVSEGRTTIIIAHRLSTIQNADKIIVVDGGRIVGDGTHNALLESCAEYSNLVKKQVSISV